ncbi:MAG: hypothetical protein N2746_09680 [Deltaproteobacteria bacterium]|nr:hypothetical protein [Deltaproteobacteria bacterium]
MSKKNKLNAIFLSLLLLLLLFACVRHRGRTNVHFGFVFVPFSSGLRAESVYTHDDHIHDEFCGHPKKWYNGRWVYYYNGNWEYYDYNENVYYYIPSELIEDVNE